MHLRELRAYLLPGAAERDPGFRELISKLSVFGLKVTAGVTVGVSVFATLSRVVLLSDSDITLPARLIAMVLLVSLGLLAYGATYTAFGRRNARGLTMTLAVLVSVLLNHFALRVSALDRLSNLHPEPDHADPAGGRGCCSAAPDAGAQSGHCARSSLPVQANLARQLLALAAARFRNICISFRHFLCWRRLSGVLYRQRYLNYQSYVRGLEAAEQLRRAETRVLLSDHAASLGRIAAALSHELNSPVGALKSAVDTMVLINARLAQRRGGARSASPPAKPTCDGLSRTVRHGLRASWSACSGSRTSTGPKSWRPT